MPHKDKEERKLYQKKWYQNNKKRRYEQNKKLAKRNKNYIQLRKSVPCKDCKIKYPYYVMDFDHVRGEKNFRISRGLRHGIKKLKEEIEKCEVVCANCHRVRTQNNLADKQDLSLVSETVDRIATVT